MLGLVFCRSDFWCKKGRCGSIAYDFSEASLAMHITVAVIDKTSFEVNLSEIDVPAGATAADAARQAGLDPSKIEAYAVFARKISADTPLSEGDRLDVGTPLLVDPMTARRLRAQHKALLPAPRPRHGGKHQLIKPLDI